jgi:hypothetical protein
MDNARGRLSIRGDISAVTAAARATTDAVNGVIDAFSLLVLSIGLDTVCTGTCV